MDKNNLQKAVNDTANEQVSPSGDSYLCLNSAAIKKLASSFDISARLVEMAALEGGVIPERYQRSLGTVGINGQINLLKSTAGVLGAGGLGGFVLELLARMGVGNLVVVDDDIFTESNLNRQLMATEINLGQSKAEAAAKRIEDINSAVEVKACSCRGDAENLSGLFSRCDVVLDCLDNLPSRFDLEKACTELNIPMVHGAIAGFLGQLTVIRPGRPVLSKIYGEAAGGARQGVEAQLGNPAFTPAMLASWQSAEAIKLLAGLDGALPEGKLLVIDMQSGESYSLDLG